LDDYISDFLIVGEVLHREKHSCESVESLIRQMVNKFSVEDVWVAGHSLGAAIALIATRELALEGKLLETHLFHPPNSIVGVLARKSFQSLAKGVGDAFASSTGTDPKRIRKAAGGVARPVDKEFKIIANRTGRLVAPTYSKDKVEECDELLRAKWTPHLYVNSKDPICNEFITRFKSKCQYDTAKSCPPSITLSSAIGQGIARQDF